MVAGDGKVPFCQAVKRDYTWVKRGDFDSFPALFFDNLSSIFGIIGAMVFVPTIPATLGVIPQTFVDAYVNVIYARMLPALAIAIGFGNIWYAWMAWKLAGYEQRDDVTALPYGINTPAGFIMAFSVMLPLCFTYAGSPDPETFAFRVWAGAASANFVGGMFEVAGAWTGDLIRKNVSKAALYAPIASVGFVYLGYSPFLTGFGLEPIIAVFPLAIAFTGFFSNDGKGIYYSGVTSLLIFGVGTVLKWAGAGKYNPSPEVMGQQVVDAAETYAGRNELLPGVALEGFVDVDKYIFIVFPVALQSFVETMENVEAAAARGDHYNIKEAMIVDGLGTMIGGLFGATIPTTVYIGHGRHKIIGASATYSLLNALTFFIILMSGIFPMILAIIDPVSIGMVLLFVGLFIVRQSFELSVSRHYPCLVLGIMCVIADFQKNYSFDSSPAILNISAGGGIMASLVITQIVCDLTDLRFERATIFSFIATIFSLFGIMHGNNSIGPTGDPVQQGELTVSFLDGGDYTTGLNESWRFAVAYAMLTVFCIGHYVAQKYEKIIPAVMDNGDPNYKEEPKSDGMTA